MPDFPEATLLEGPVVGACVRGYGKQIFLFGDQHHISMDCSARCIKGGRMIRLEQFVSEAARDLWNRAPKETIDVMLESPKTARVRQIQDNEESTYFYTASSYIQLLEQFLVGCTAAPSCSSACYYPNIRVHLMDARQETREFEQLSNAVYGITSPVYSFWRQLHTTSWEDLSDADIAKMFKLVSHADLKGLLEAITSFIQSLGDTTTIRRLFKEYMKVVHYDKQLAMIEDPRLRRAVKGIVGSWMRKPDNAALWSTTLRQVRADLSLKKSTPLSRRRILTVVMDLGDTLTILMDSLILVRTLKTTKDHKELRNIILYAGFVHTTTLLEAFRQLGFQSVWESPPVAQLKPRLPSGRFNQCLDISGCPKVFVNGR